MENTDTQSANDTIVIVPPGADEIERSLRAFTHVTYGLMAWGVACILTNAIPAILEFFNVSIVLITAGIMAHTRRREARKYWLSNHYRYLVRTFWITALLQIFTFSFNLGLIGISTSMMAALWSGYRVIRGWINLGSLKAIPNYSSE